jgi:hypothetical protein
VVAEEKFRIIRVLFLIQCYFEHAAIALGERFAVSTPFGAADANLTEGGRQSSKLLIAQFHVTYDNRAALYEHAPDVVAMRAV